MLLAEFQRAGIPIVVPERRIVDIQQIFHREEPRDLSGAVRFHLGRELEEVVRAALAEQGG